ncbi:MAG: ATP-binding cassette domain-containing protein [Oligoflexia bacterium]|nr:ATP-binding cassette domain-containing protein [Oligoflexia bacterium]
MIEVRGLSKKFRVHVKQPGLRGSLKSLIHREWKEKEALRSVSLEVGPGEIVGLVGANGAGKTTLVKALAGILHPTSGSARVLGHVPWERNDEFRRQIALIMGQKAQLWWDLPAADCFLLLREIYRIPRARFEATLETLVQALGVGDQLKVQIRRLSLGERMKMELIAALLHQPRVVFLDEPTIGLDLTAQRSIREFLLGYLREHRPAMILTSHYMEDIERLCERIVIMREGEFVYDGPLSRIVEEFARHKIIGAELSEPTSAEALALLHRLGEPLPVEGAAIRLKVRRERVAEAASEILRSLGVVDLEIEEEDVGTIIEEIFRKGQA